MNRSIFFLMNLLLSFLLIQAATAAEFDFDDSWNGVAALADSARYEAADTVLVEILNNAKATDNSEQCGRALIERTRLRTALGAPETAVKELMNAPYPDDPFWRDVINIYIAYSLIEYQRRYSHEIRSREHINDSDSADLKTWSIERLSREINSAFLSVWLNREQWGVDSIGAWSLIVEPNSFPAHIRGTLRDAVSYLWVEYLANTRYWLPGQNADDEDLNLEQLITGNYPADADPDLADPLLNPLGKISFILADLRRWHQDLGHLEAALEANLENLRRLHQLRHNSEDRISIREYLEETLASFDSAYPWWSMGQAQLAVFFQQDDCPDCLIRALQEARKGVRHHRERLGGRLCADIVADIEKPHYYLHSMDHDAAEERSIQVKHKNLEKLYFRAWKYDPAERLVDGENAYPSGAEIEIMVEKLEPDLVWILDLPETIDYRTHITFTGMPSCAPGAYIVACSRREDFAPEDNSISAVDFIVSDLVITSHSLPDGSECLVRSGKSGQALEDVELIFYRQFGRSNSPAKEITRARTDATGRARLKEIEVKYYSILARKGDDLAWINGARSFQKRQQSGVTSSFIYTDRSIYRPGQTVHWKVVGYEGNPERTEFHTLGDKSVTVTLKDSNSQGVLVEEVTTNDFGSASGSFKIPAGHLLGRWRITDSFGGNTQFKVEQYKRPTFEARFLDPEKPLQMNQPAVLTGQVEYYFGLPVTSGTASWRVTRAPNSWGFRGYSHQYNTEVIATGEAVLDDKGQFQVEFEPEADPRLADDEKALYRFYVYADITSEGGETRPAARTFNLGFVSVLATVSADFGFMAADKPGQFTVKRMDLNEVPQVGNGQWYLHRLLQPERTMTMAETPPEQRGKDKFVTRTPGDDLNPRWLTSKTGISALGDWETGPRLSEGRVEHDADGLATIQLEDLAGGAYRLIYKTEDDQGRIREVPRDFLADGPNPGPLNLPLVMEPEFSTAAVGSVLRLYLSSGFPDQEIYLQVFTANQRILTEFRTSGRGPRVIEIPVTEAARKGLTVRASAIRDFERLEATRHIPVPWDNKILNLEFATFRDRLTPGDDESFTIKVSSLDGTPLDQAATELLAYMYDRSLDVMTGHRPPSPRYVFPNRQWPGGTDHSLGHGRQRWRGGLRPKRSKLGQPLHSDRVLLYPYAIIHRRSRRGGDTRLGLDPDVVASLKSDGIPIAQTFDVEGAEYMVEVKSAVTEHSVGSETFEKYAIDSVDDALAKQAGVIMRAGELYVRGGRSGNVSIHFGPDDADSLRKQFSETAFFLPHVLIDGEGQATIEFKVPDSVTEWNIWVHALTRDLSSGSAQRQAATVKDLMVRPNLPRFMREGDTADLHVVINNAGETELQGRLELKIQDPETGQDLCPEFGLLGDSVSFLVEPQGENDLVFPLRAPAHLGAVQVTALARTDNLSDGEQRLLPILPGRMHLMQSRFAALDDSSRCELSFSMMADDDDTTRIQEQLIVTVDAQLFGSVLGALPYLIEYPYECTEQTLNRYLCTSILSGVFAEHPQVRAMAEQMSERENPTEAWVSSDPNRRLLLEETPWLRTSRGGMSSQAMINLLAPEVADQKRKTALHRLADLQDQKGGFPWFPGGQPSPYLTLYILQGFARGAEFGLEPPESMVRSAWKYLHTHFEPSLRTSLNEGNLSVALVTLLNYLMSSYSDDVWGASGFTTDDQERMLEYSFASWRQHSLLLKGYLALTLQRAGLEDGARMVFASVMDAAKTDPDLGTYWAPEDRAWLWYNDSIESHAFSLRVLTELNPEDPRRKGLVQWLLLNKKLGHWKSTRATSEAIYALVHFMEQEGTLAVREAIDVQAGQFNQRLIFDPEQYTGRNNQIVLVGDEIDPESMATVVLKKDTPGLAFASATWHFSTEQMPTESNGDLFTVSRKYYLRKHDGRQWVLQPLAMGDPVALGDQIEVQLSVSTKQAAEYVHLRDPRGAGFEPESMTSGYRWKAGLGYYEEVRDSGANFFFSRLPTGQYTLKYRLRASMSGAFKVGPATLQSMYAPEFTAHSAGRMVTVSP